MKYIVSLLFFISVLLSQDVIAKANYQTEINYLAMAIHHEARGESYKGKVAVANVIFNRTKHKEFPSTIRQVVSQRGQFQWYRNYSLRAKSAIPKETWELANTLYWQYVMDVRQDNTKGSIFFTSNGRRPAARATHSVRIGGHQFYGLRQI